MKKWIFVLVGLLMAVTVAGCLGPSPEDVSGTYVNQDNSRQHLELKEDGTFLLKMAAYSQWGGEWKVKGNEIKLSFYTGTVTKAKIKGNTIVDEEGSVWVKQ